MLRASPRAMSLSATLTQATGLHMMTPNGAISPTTSHTVSVPLSASVGGAALGAAVGLALLGGAGVSVVAGRALHGSALRSPNPFD